MAPAGSLLEQIAERLTEVSTEAVDVEQTTPVGGGSINDAWRLDTNAGRYFLKTNSADRFPSMFEAEADGLERLRAAQQLPVPELFGQGEDHGTTWLLLQWLEPGNRKPGFWKTFGEKLARQHRITQDAFGLERDNYIGSLKQNNAPENDWPSFYIHQRLEPMLKMARDRRKIQAGMVFRSERLFSRMDRLFPKEPPALLHGDLWSGNFLTGPDGEAWLIDPAVYYGHREMDLAMSKLFGGFHTAFYEAYIHEWPLEQDWEERIPLGQLYPLLVHVNLFGGGYIDQVEAVFRKYTE